MICWKSLRKVEAFKIPKSTDQLNPSRKLHFNWSETSKINQVFWPQNPRGLFTENSEVWGFRGFPICIYINETETCRQCNIAWYSKSYVYIKYLYINKQFHIWVHIWCIYIDLKWKNLWGKPPQCTHQRVSKRYFYSSAGFIVELKLAVGRWQSLQLVSWYRIAADGKLLVENGQSIEVQAFLLGWK